MSNWADFTTGKRIKHLRGSDLTQQGLAEAAGVSLALVQKAEQDRGELSVGSLLRIAGALNTDVSVVLGQQAPRRGASRDTRAALRRLSDAVHESASGTGTVRGSRARSASCQPPTSAWRSRTGAATTVS